MKVTVRSIAEKADVSPASVSRYFNEPESVSEEVARKIENAIYKLDAVPSTRVKKQLILIIVTHLRYSFYDKAIRELLDQEKGRFNFLFYGYDPSRPELLRSLSTRLKPEGVIYFEEEIDREILDFLNKKGIRTVMCGGIAVHRGSEMVHVNDLAAAYQGTQYLLENDHKQILFLSDEVKKISAGFQRIQGSRKAMEEAGLSLDEEYVRYGDVTYECGYQAVQNALQNKLSFTAVFAFSDELAVGAMAALYDAGIQVPQQVSVLGFDDLPIAQKVRPALTTIHQPVDMFVKKALELLTREADSVCEEVLLPHTIVERGSCSRCALSFVSTPARGKINEKI